VGNLPVDAPCYIIDTLMARHMSMSKHLIWYSDTGKPDLGGHEDKNYRSYFNEEIENPDLNNKGFYRKYTVEIGLDLLAVNTIL
jgi:DNA polymerase epsilon subunit 1